MYNYEKERVGSVFVEYTTPEGMKVVEYSSVLKLLFGENPYKYDSSLIENSVNNWINSLDEKVIINGM